MYLIVIYIINTFLLLLLVDVPSIDKTEEHRNETGDKTPPSFGHG